MDDLHKLPKVCRYWREVALATPTLWNTVVTVPHPQGRRDSCFGRSIYLPEDLPVGLIVHFNPRWPSNHCIEKMTDFMLTNSSRIRELHAWDSSSIEDLMLFLRSFDATALEHCTVSLRGGRHMPTGRWARTGLPFSLFSNGGARLRSLCLHNLTVLPAKKFPALTLFKISFDERPSGSVCLDIKDLVKFLASSPKLEEVYVQTILHSDRGSNRPPAHPTPISLPCLQYLEFSYSLSLDTVSGNETYLIDILLSLISIPPTCHMHLSAPIAYANKHVEDILASVCHRVPGKNALSHMFIHLSGSTNLLQLVFRQGSLRFEIPRSAGLRESEPFAYHDLFRAFSRLFATVEELRIHYSTSDRITTALISPIHVEAFPNVTAVSIIRLASGRPARAAAKPTLRAGLAHLVQPSTASTGPGVAVDSQSCPYPALETLWTSVESSADIAELEATLAARAALGVHIRRLVVTVRYPMPPDSEDAERLEALGAEDVIVMPLEAETVVGEVDWMVRLPKRYSLPSSVHREWPTVWGWQKRGEWDMD